MIEEVTDLSGDASTITLAPTKATATDADESAPAEKPKRRRVTKKVADAELPLEGVEAKPKRATRKKKTDETSANETSASETSASENSSGDDEAAPAKPKRATRAKKTEATAPQTSEKLDAPAFQAPDTPAAEQAAPVIEQTISDVSAPLQMAPAIAMGSFTPAFNPAQDKAEVAREVNAENAVSSLEREMNRATIAANLRPNPTKTIFATAD